MGCCRPVTAGGFGAGLGLVGVGMVGVGVGQGGGRQYHNLAGVSAVGSCWVGSQYQLSWIVLCWVVHWAGPGLVSRCRLGWTVLRVGGVVCNLVSQYSLDCAVSRVGAGGLGLVSQLRVGRALFSQRGWLV